MSKSQRILDALGPEVEIANRRLPKDPNLSRRLAGLGQDIKPMLDEGMEYKGSFATHIYANEFGREVRFVHQNTKVRVSEKVVSSAVSDLALHLMQVLFGRKKPATRDPKDQRGKKEL